MIKKYETLHVDSSACIYTQFIVTDPTVLDIVCREMLHYESNVGVLLVCRHVNNFKEL